MLYQSAQVTSSQVKFPVVTRWSLGEYSFTQNSVLRGKFPGGRNDLAWLARGPHLEVVNSVTGERLSAFHFRGTKLQSPTIRVVKEFSWESRTGLLIGLEEAERSVLCLYDIGAATVVKEVVLPGRVTAVEPIANHAGPSVFTQHLHQSLRWLFGVVAVATDVGHLFLLDLCLDYSCWIPNEIKALDLKFVTTYPGEVPQRRETATSEGRHLCFQLQTPSGTAISTLSYISRSNQLIVGFSDGCLSLWNMKTLRREHHCQLEGGRIPVYAVAFQEPVNDPNNRCYLWAVQSTQESDGRFLSLHLVQLTFGHQKRLASGQVMYEGLEHCQERFSLDVAGGILPLIGQTSNTKLLSCQTIEVFDRDVHREVTSPYTSISIFSWQANTCGQEKPSTYLGVFDIKCWYDAHMPDSLRPEEFLPSCPYFALWSVDHVTNTATPNPILDILVNPPSLTRGALPCYQPPEDFVHACDYHFDAVCLLVSGVVHITCTGFQKKEEQLEELLVGAAKTGSFTLLTECIKQWTSEKQPIYATNLQFLRDCAWNKVVYIKAEFDRICAPLFDGSCKLIVPQMLQSLQDCQILLDNLSKVLNCLGREERDLTEEGFEDFTKKQVLASHYSLHAKVVIWFCQSGFLPDCSNKANHLSTPLYNYPLLQTFYTDQRKKGKHLSRGKWRYNFLKIDEIICPFGEQLAKLWRGNIGGTGIYPPPNLHALLDVYLLQGIDETSKHAITMYFLQDISHSLKEKVVNSFAAAFAIPRCIVMQIQELWLLDHSDYEYQRTPYLREGAAARTSTLHHSGRVLPRVQRKLANERAKPYNILFSSLFREVPKPTPRPIVVKQAKAVNVRTRATAIRDEMSKLETHFRETKN